MVYRFRCVGLPAELHPHNGESSQAKRREALLLYRKTPEKGEGTLP